MKNTFLGTLLAIAVVGTQQLSANMMLLDRGLPTANLNNTAGANRANVGWAFGGYTPQAYWLAGDTFANTSSSTWSIESIRLWSTSPILSVNLLGGIDGSGVYGSTPGTITTATYAVFDANNQNTYQGSGGTYRDIWQLDFAVNITLAAGQTYSFFLDGTGNGTIVVPFVHASNAALSGSPQEGADNLMLYANVVNGVLAPSSVGTWTSLGNGWDKASDVNVQVFGTVPEAGATLGLLGCAVVVLGVLRRKLSV